MARRLILPDERPQSWNTFYSGTHWSNRRDEAERVHQLVGLCAGAASVAEQPVDITVTAYFAGRPLDPCNITAKLYIDGLIGKWIKDDSPEFVRSVTTRSRVDKENPRVEIEMSRATN